MPICFTTIPWELQIGIIHKMGCKEYAEFQQTSKLSRNTSKYLKTFSTIPKLQGENVIFRYENEEIDINFGVGKKPFNVHQNPEIRMDAIQMKIQSTLTDEFSEKIIDFFQRTGSTAKSLSFGYFARDFLVSRTILCSPETFKRLLETIKIKSLPISTWHSIAPSYLRAVPKNVEDISAESPLEDEDFLSLNASVLKIACTKITDKGINQFLKEWVNGTRQFKELSISRFDTIFLKEDILLEINFLRTKDRNVVHIFRGSECLQIEIGPIQLYAVVEKIHVDQEAELNYIRSNNNIRGKLRSYHFGSGRSSHAGVGSNSFDSYRGYGLFL